MHGDNIKPGREISRSHHSREHLNSDMRDKELSYWTCRGVQTAGFFVATINDQLVGTVSYTKEVIRCIMYYVLYYNVDVVTLSRMTPTIWR